MKDIKSNLLTLVVFIFSLVVYIITAAPDVTFIDSGELGAVCSTLGVAHPSGYPLFTILGWFWTQLPLPFSKIFSLNILASIYTAAAASMFFRASLLFLTNVKLSVANDKTHKDKKNKPISDSQAVSDKGKLMISFAAALTLAFARTFWAQGNAIEVYSLQIFLLNCILYFMLKAIFLPEIRMKMFCATGFFLGLGLANHLTTMFIIPAALYLFFKRPSEKFTFNKDRLKSFGLVLLFSLLGLSFYLYLPLRSASHPEFNWGWVHVSLSKFLYHFEGAQYRIWMFSSLKAIQTNFTDFIQIMPFQFAFIGLIPTVYGFFTLQKSCKELAYFFVIMIAFYLLYTLNYSIHDIDNYFLPVYIALGFFMVFGCYKLYQKYKFVLAGLFIIAAVNLGINYSSNDQSGDYMVAEYTRIMTDNLNENAIIFTSQWDYYVSAFFYKQGVEGYRKDVAIIDPELLRRTWYIKQLRVLYPEILKDCNQQIEQFLAELELFESKKSYSDQNLQMYYENLINAIIDNNQGSRPIYLTAEFADAQQKVARNFKKIPQGFAMRLEKEDKTYEVSTDKIDITKFVTSLNHSSGKLVSGIRNVAAFNLTNIARYSISTSQLDVAEKALNLALSVDPAYKEALVGKRSLESKKTELEQKKSATEKVIAMPQ